MRSRIASITVALVLVLSRAGAPQTPQLSAAEPVVFAGATYYPSGPTVFFDGAVMVRVGSYLGVPVYVDPTREATHTVYVPVSGKLMRPYERRRDEEAAALVVQPAPSQPDIAGPPPEPTEPATISEPGTVEAPAVPYRPRLEPPPSRGIWIEFGGKTWSPSGPGPERSPQLKVIGYYFNFPVFQESSRRDRIFVPSMLDGPLIRYDLRRE